MSIANYDELVSRIISFSHREDIDSYYDKLLITINQTYANQYTEDNDEDEDDDDN